MALINRSIPRFENLKQNVAEDACTRALDQTFKNGLDANTREQDKMLDERNQSCMVLREELLALRKAKAELEMLHAAGVENWSGYMLALFPFKGDTIEIIEHNLEEEII